MEEQGNPTSQLCSRPMQIWSYSALLANMKSYYIPLLEARLKTSFDTEF